MIDIFLPFVKQVLSYCGFKPSQLPKKYYRDLLTALQDLPEQSVVMLPSLIEWVRPLPGLLIVDDTSNPKYGLKPFLKTLKNHANQQRFQGYKILVFLWQVGNLRMPIGFALSHQLSPTPPDLALRGFSQLRNQHHLKPQCVLGDAGFSTDEIVKRLTDYGWPLVMRSKKNRKLDGQQAKQAIARGYGEYCASLKNGTRVKMLRRRNFFVLSNRLLLKSSDILALYRNRWCIEEVFRVLKTCIGLNRCQQHSMKAQAIYLILCFLIFSCLELHSQHFGHSDYYLHRQLILGHISPQDILKQELFNMG